MFQVAEEYERLGKQAEEVLGEIARWRSHANSVRAKARRMINPLSAQAMQQAAKDFEFLADYAELPRRLAL